jgi:hypothetical protein
MCHLGRRALRGSWLAVKSAFQQEGLILAVCEYARCSLFASTVQQGCLGLTVLYAACWWLSKAHLYAHLHAHLCAPNRSKPQKTWHRCVTTHLVQDKKRALSISRAQRIPAQCSV